MGWKTVCRDSPLTQQYQTQGFILELASHLRKVLVGDWLEELDACGRGWGLVAWFGCWWVLMEWVGGWWVGLGGWWDGLGASGMGWELMG